MEKCAKTYTIALFLIFFSTFFLTNQTVYLSIWLSKEKEREKKRFYLLNSFKIQLFSSYIVCEDRFFFRTVRGFLRRSRSPSWLFTKSSRDGCPLDVFSMGCCVLEFSRIPRSTNPFRLYVQPIPSRLFLESMAQSDRTYICQRKINIIL